MCGLEFLSHLKGWICLVEEVVLIVVDVRHISNLSFLYQFLSSGECFVICILEHLPCVNFIPNLTLCWSIGSHMCSPFSCIIIECMIKILWFLNSMWLTKCELYSRTCSVELPQSWYTNMVVDLTSYIIFSLIEIMTFRNSYNCKDLISFSHLLVYQFFVKGGMEGHLSRDCTTEPKAKSCYKCGEEGHIVCRKI